MLKVFISRNFPDKILKIITDAGIKIDVWKDDKPVDYENLKQRTEDVDGILCTLTEKVNEDIIKSSKSLKVISTMSVGFDHIDLDAAKDKNIKIGFTPHVLNDATAELAVGLLLMVSRRLYEGVNVVKTNLWGSWNPFFMCGTELSNKTIGIIGLGSIGKSIAVRLKGFGIKKVLSSGSGRQKSDDELKISDNFSAEDCNLKKLLNESDVVIVSCELNKKTKHMINSSVFNEMKNSAIFINIARGDIVKQDDLYDALKEGKIAAAGLDVCTPEPLPSDHKLLSLSNCIVVPHIGSATMETREMMATVAAHNLVNGLQGKEMISELKL